MSNISAGKILLIWVVLTKKSHELKLRVGLGQCKDCRVA
jgi:hypothetical protein